MSLMYRHFVGDTKGWVEVKKSELDATVAKVAEEAKKHVAAFPVIHVTSSEKGMGIAELRVAVLEDALGADWA